MATELGQAYVQIIPSAKGISGAISKQLDPEASSAGISAGNSLGSKLVTVVKGVIATAAIGKTIGAALTEGANLEQSLGGIETLFKGSADKVKKYADEAYKTSGLSANAYMENVTSFSASLLQSVGGDTEKAADVANMAMIDMSDNANKMGSNMGDIQNAYQGFAKQNYTMLDNLKLGYGGTKEEMQRLLTDAEKLTGVKYDISNLSDVYNAIHAIQGKLDITGTTAKEAAETFSGSFAAMKASFSNVLGKMALGQDIKPSLNQLAETTSTFLVGNFIPMVANILKALPGAIVTFIKASIPYVKSAFGELLGSISETFPVFGKMVDWIQKNAEMFKFLGSVALGALAGFLAFKGAISIFTSLKTAITGIKTAFTVLKAAMLANPFGVILVAVGALVAGLMYLYKTNENVRNSINNVAGKAKELISNFAKSETVTKALSNGMKLVSEIGDKVANAIGNIGKKASSSAGSVDWFGVAFKVVKTVILALLGPIGLAIKAFTLIAKVLGGGEVKAGIDQMISSFSTLASGIKQNAPEIGTSFGTAMQGILTAIANALSGIIAGGLRVIAGFISGIAQGLPQIALAAAQLITAFTTSMLLLIPIIVLSATQIIVAFLAAFTVALPQIILAGTNLINSLLQGITLAIPSLVANTAVLITTWLTSLNAYLPMILQAGFNLLITFLQGIANNIGQVAQQALNIIINFANVIIQNMPTIVNTAVNLMVSFLNALASRMPDIIQSAVTLIVNFVNGIANNLDQIINAAVNLIVKFLSGIANKIPDIVNAAMGLVDAMVRGVIDAQDRLMNAAITLINGFATNIRNRKGDIRDAALNLLDAIVGVFVPDSLYDTGKNLIQGLINGIGSMVDSVASKISEVAGNIKGRIQSALGIHSPSRWMRDMIGQNMMLGWQIGIDKNAKYPTNALLNAGKTITSNLHDQLKNVQSLASGITSTDSLLNFDDSDISMNVTKEATSRAIVTSSKVDTTTDNSESLDTITNILLAILEKDFDVLLDGDSLVDKTKTKMATALEKMSNDAATKKGFRRGVSV
ncbi:hypothetical protein [Enterococcus sp. DIV0174]